MNLDIGAPTRPPGDSTNAAATTAFVTGAIATAIAGIVFPTSPIPAGTVMVFYQASAPSGWTSVALNDRALRVVSAGGTGGTGGGSNAFSTVFAQTVVGSHTLTQAEMPSHVHGYIAPGGAVNVGVGFCQTAAGPGSGTGTNSAGSDGAHNHAITMSITYSDVIVCSKN